ncbi:MAG: response regulator [Myxococcales bacterium]|nr:response regulator [Myxococcales bacterium]
MKQILIVDDEPAVADVLEFALRRAGFSPSTVGTLAAARQALRGSPPPALVVLDLGLPDGDGLDLCRWLRQRSDVPVLMLTCRDEEIDRVLGLEQGADDYVVKPFSPREVVARVRTILRRTEGARTPAVLSHGDVTLDVEAHRVHVHGHEVELTPREFDLLHTLLRAPARVFSRDDLVEQAYRGEALVSGRTVDSHIKGIRRKFAAVSPGFDPIETVYGVGYRARAGR